MDASISSTASVSCKIVLPMANYPERVPIRLPPWRRPATPLPVSIIHTHTHTHTRTLDTLHILPHIPQRAQTPVLSSADPDQKSIAIAITLQTAHMDLVHSLHP